MCAPYGFGEHLFCRLCETKGLHFAGLEGSVVALPGMTRPFTITLLKTHFGCSRSLSLAFYRLPKTRPSTPHSFSFGDRYTNDMSDASLRLTTEVIPTASASSIGFSGSSVGPSGCRKGRRYERNQHRHCQLLVEILAIVSSRRNIYFRQS